ncbi:LysR family transcriptional regulator [Ahrensia sp. R2A130]|uniref:LysR family transcriptional regulator n=1 Tax=Ahrensia sp. R2A130 TaxID=744979 RepID=UPI0001E0E83A|nr:LysR family transcriptional regulator [Ahrensia sp. R2A130]EFL90918.1 LysR family transcriptional regulator [Ahrensia sp. R2A130]
MDIDVLHTFIDVFRHGSFASAARERNVDPSSVSRQIAVLEDELGYRLFERTTRRLSATEAGRVYHDRIAGFIDELTLAREAGADVLGAPKGQLRVTASVAFGERWLIPRIATFQTIYPEVELDLILSDAVVDIAAEGIDLGIRLGTRMSGSLVATRLLQTRYRVVAAPDYIAQHGQPVSPVNLGDHNCLVFRLPGYRSHWRFRSGAGDITEVEVRGTLSISNALALRRATLDGFGIALLADWTVDADIEAGALIDLFPAFVTSAADFDTAAWIVYPSRAYVPHKTRAFIDHLKAST